MYIECIQTAVDNQNNSKIVAVGMIWNVVLTMAVGSISVQLKMYRNAENNSIPYKVGRMTLIKRWTILW